MNPDGARNLALSLHGDQKYGPAPYSLHLDDVARVVREFGLGETFEIAAYLHDVLEDTHATSDLLMANGVSEDVIHLIEAVTGRGQNRKARNADAYRKLQAFPKAISLKLADRIANTRRAEVDAHDKLAMYFREYSSFRGALREHGGNVVMWDALDKLYGFRP